MVLEVSGARCPWIAYPLNVHWQFVKVDGLVGNVAKQKMLDGVAVWRGKADLWFAKSGKLRETEEAVGCL